MSLVQSFFPLGLSLTHPQLTLDVPVPRPIILSPWPLPHPPTPHTGRSCPSSNHSFPLASPSPTYLPSPGPLPHPPSSPAGAARAPAVRHRTKRGVRTALGLGNVFLPSRRGPNESTYVGPTFSGGGEIQARQTVLALRRGPAYLLGARACLFAGHGASRPR